MYDKKYVQRLKIGAYQSFRGLQAPPKLSYVSQSDVSKVLIKSYPFETFVHSKILNQTRLVISSIHLCTSSVCSAKLKVQMKWYFIAEFERTAKIRKIAVYYFLISRLLVPEL